MHVVETNKGHVKDMMMRTTILTSQFLDPPFLLGLFSDSYGGH